MIEYLGLGKTASFSGAGLFYGHPKQLAIQAGAALTIIVWDGIVTFVILRVLGLFMKLRLPEADLEIGDVAVHGEEAYPSEGLVSVSASHMDPLSAARTPTTPGDSALAPGRAAKSTEDT